MTSASRALQAADDGGFPFDGIVAALSAQHAVVTGADELVRSAHLDTFDRRLRSAGLTLEHRVAARHRTLILGRTDGSSIAVVAAGSPRWPALAGTLPAGPVRDEVARAAGIRALTAVSDDRRRVRVLELHNEDGKTVARVELDEPASGAGAPARLTVHALRGYDDQARRAARLLIGLGLRPVDGRAPAAPADDGPPPVAFDRDAPAEALLASVLSGFLATMRENLPGLLGDVDTEFLHDFRVSLRRTRSTLRLGRPALPEAMRTRWEPAFKELGDLTTPLRDLDVYELGLPSMAHWLVAAAPGDLEPFARHLRRRRTAARLALVREFRSARFRRLLTEWEQELARLAEPRGTRDTPDTPDTPEDSEGEDPERPSAGQLADRSISRARREVARGGAAITADSPAEDLHRLRKRCKELRYALEIFAPVIDDGPRDRVILATLKGLQDVLGRFQDSEVQRSALREFADEMMSDGTPAAPVLAMGELIAHLDADQARARHEFDGAFDRFARSSGHRPIPPIGGNG